MGISPQNKDEEPVKSPPLSYANVALKHRTKPKPQNFPKYIYKNITVDNEN